MNLPARCWGLFLGLAVLAAPTLAVNFVAGIPTLNEWGIMVLCLFMGCWFVRRVRVVGAAAT